MSDRRMQVFHAVAKHLSFTKAAEALFMTQPAVTFQVKQLEDQLNVRLFDRGHGRISLTPAGEVVLDYARRLLDLYDELGMRLDEMTGQMRGSLVIGASTTIAAFMLPRVLGEFNALYPQVRTRLIVANSESIGARIVERTLDIGLIEGLPHLPDLECEPCCEDELLAICAPDYPLAELSQATPQLLRDYEFISREPGSGTREVTDNYFRAAGIDPASLKTVMELGSPEALKGLVESGLGYAIVSRVVCEKERRLGSLVTVPLQPRLKRNLSLVFPKDRFRSHMVTTFVAFAQQKLREFVL